VTVPLAPTSLVKAAARVPKYINERRFKHVRNIDIDRRVQQYHFLPIFGLIESESTYRRAADSNLKAAHWAPIPRYDISDLGFAVLQYVWTGHNGITSHETWRDARRDSEHCQGVRIDAGTVNECPCAWAMAICIKIIIITIIIIRGDPNIFIGSITIIIIIITRLIKDSGRHRRVVVVDLHVHWQVSSTQVTQVARKLGTISGCMLQLLNCELFWFPAWLFLLAFLSTGSHLGLGPEMPM
jgi:hypothetical protein